MRVLTSMMAIVLILILVSGIRCDANSDPPESEIEQLKSKVASLESRCINVEKEIREKDEKLSLLEKNIEPKYTQAASLASEIELFQNSSADTDETLQKANAHNQLLEKQVKRLQIELEKQVRKMEDLEEKLYKTEQTARQLGRRLEYATKIKERQRLKFQQLEHNLENAQNELDEVQARDNVIAEELEKEHETWIPHWLSSHVLCFQEMLSRNWNKLVRSVSEEFVPKIVERSTKLMELIGSHMELANNAAYTKSSDVYEICMDAITPRFIKAKQIMRPYLQRVKKLFGSFFAGAS